MSKSKLCSEKSPSPSSSGVQEQWPTTIHYLKIVEHSWSFLSTESISSGLLGYPDPTDIRKGENKIIFIYKIRNQKMEVENKTWRSYIYSHDLIKSMWYKVWPERAQGMGRIQPWRDALLSSVWTDTKSGDRIPFILSLALGFPWSSHTPKSVRASYLNTTSLPVFGTHLPYSGVFKTQLFDVLLYKNDSYSAGS